MGLSGLRRYGLRFNSSFGTFAGSGRNYVFCVCLCCCVLCLGKGWEFTWVTVGTLHGFLSCMIIPRAHRM